MFVVVAIVMNEIMKRDTSKSKSWHAHAELGCDFFEIHQPTWRISNKSRDISQISLQQVSQLFSLFCKFLISVTSSPPKVLSSMFSPAAARSVTSVKVGTVRSTTT